MKTPMNENIEIDIEYFLFIFIVFYTELLFCDNFTFQLSTILLTFTKYSQRNFDSTTVVGLSICYIK